MSQLPPPDGRRPSSFDPMLGLLAIGALFLLSLLFACLVL